MFVASDHVLQNDTDVEIRANVVGPWTMKATIWAEDETACTGQLMAWTYGHHGIWSWAIDSHGPASGLVLGTGVSAMGVDPLGFLTDAPVPTLISMSDQPFQGERTLFAAISSIVANDDAPNLWVDLHCPGATITTEFGHAPTSLHWVTMDVAADTVWASGAVERERTWETTSNAHLHMINWRGADSIVVLESDDGRTLYGPEWTSIDVALEPGSHTLRQASSGGPPIGIVFETTPMSAYAWYLQAATK